MLDFEELDYQRTRLGELILRRRRIPELDNCEVFEVKLGEEFLMSSLFSEGEIALAKRGLADADGSPKDVVVGGLGLGYTAAAALDDPSVQSLLVIEALPPVIDWHRRGLVPLGRKLTTDSRCRLIEGDFFALADPVSGRGFDPLEPGRRFHAVLLDIDHSPRHLLNPGHAAFYSDAGMNRMKDTLHPGGVFALWSNDPPDAEFLEMLNDLFDRARVDVVSFDNPITGGQSSNTVYIARTESAKNETS